MKTQTRPLVAVPSALVALLLLLAGCGAGGGGARSDASSTAAGGSTAAEGPARSPAQKSAQNSAQDVAQPATGRSALSAAGSADVGPLSRSVISTGELTVRAGDLDRVRAQVLRLVTVWGGLVADEKTTSDRRGRTTDSVLTLRVPSPRFSDAITALGRLGTVEQQDRSSEDVTTQVIDNDARVRAGERSIRQIENLLSRATKLGEVIAIESDLARRQADLDSLKSQQKWLQDQTTLSTITLSLTRTTTRTAPATKAHGFLAGLDDGWHALGGVTVGLLTLVGVLLPFLVLVVLLGVPVWLLLRRRRTPVAEVAPEG